MNIISRKISVGPESEVSAVWAVPDAYRPGRDAGLILAHGAGNDMHSAFISTVHEQLARRGVLTVKFNFPYKERGGKAPDRAPVLEAAWRAVAAAVRADELAPGRLFLGGKSMGGRMATHLAAAGEPCAGLVLLGYPLHPARKPEKLRVEHLPRIRCPMLFIEGTRDPLCDLTLLRGILATLSAPVTLYVIEGGDHSFNLPKRLGRDGRDVFDEIVSVTEEWMHRSQE